MKLFLIIFFSIFITIQANAKPIFDKKNCNEILESSKTNFKFYNVFIKKGGKALLDNKKKEADTYGELMENELNNLVKWATIFNAFCK